VQEHFRTYCHVLISDYLQELHNHNLISSPASSEEGQQQLTDPLRHSLCAVLECCSSKEASTHLHNPDDFPTIMTSTWHRKLPCIVFFSSKVPANSRYASQMLTVSEIIALPLTILLWDTGAASVCDLPAWQGRVATRSSVSLAQRL
jgi:hypothetical protein